MKGQGIGGLAPNVQLQSQKDPDLFGRSRNPINHLPAFNPTGHAQGLEKFEVVIKNPNDKLSSEPPQRRFGPMERDDQ